MFSHKVPSHVSPSAYISFSSKTMLANKKWELNFKAQRRLGETGQQGQLYPFHSMTKVIFIVQEVLMSLETKKV